MEFAKNNRSIVGREDKLAKERKRSPKLRNIEIEKALAEAETIWAMREDRKPQNKEMSSYGHGT